MKKRTKKVIISSLLGAAGMLSLAYVVSKNRQMSGIIKNQKNTIDGLIREVKNLSYHLGKK